MKRTFAMFLVVCTLVALLPVSKLESAAASVYPASCTLVGSSELPPVDSQGGVGCCASNAITYTQFSNAVARYLHAADPSRLWLPSSGSRSALFSPKYTYTYSGSGTAWVYDVLQDHGCLTLQDSAFYKDAEGGSQYRVNGALWRNAIKWDLENDLMQKALQYRIRGYEQIWVTTSYLDPNQSTVNGEKNVSITKTEKGLALLDKIRDAINRGNVVVTGGYPSRWLYSRLSKGGTLGKEGERAVFSAGGNSSGGHQVAIVAYDDEIECTVAGVTLKGGFQIVNSWGTTWENGGYAWIMYDALNTVSEYEVFNEEGFYSCDMYLDKTPDGKIVMNPAFAASADQTATFKRVTNVNVNGTIYKAYTISSEALGGYLAYSPDAEDCELSVKQTADKYCYWAMVPYSDLTAWGQFNQENYDAAYEGSYWLVAVNRVTDDINGYRYLDAGISPTSIGRGVGIASFYNGKYPVAKSWYVQPDATKASVQSPIGIYAERGSSLVRTWAMDQFCFLYWDEDLTAELPELMVKMDVTTTNREAVYATLYRRPLNGGSTQSQIPAIFQYASNGYHPTYDSFNWRTLGGGTLTFSGVENSTVPETATFYLSYSDLLYNLPKGADYTDYQWGISFSAFRCTPITVHNVQLLNQKGEVLDTLALPEGGLTLEPSATVMSSKRTSSTYYFDLPAAAQNCKVTVQSGDLTVTEPAGSYRIGEPYSFKVTAPKGYKASNVTVRKNGAPLLGKDGVYTTVIASDCLITVSADLEKLNDRIQGDITGDGLVSIQDVSALLVRLASGDCDPEIDDLNGDGILSIQDISQLLLLISRQ